MNVLVLGSGGREHAIITSFTNSKLVNKIYALPGNGEPVNCYKYSR